MPYMECLGSVELSLCHLTSLGEGHVEASGGKEVSRPAVSGSVMPSQGQATGSRIETGSIYREEIETAGPSRQVKQPSEPRIPKCQKTTPGFRDPKEHQVPRHSVDSICHVLLCPSVAVHLRPGVWRDLGSDTVSNPFGETYLHEAS